MLDAAKSLKSNIGKLNKKIKTLEVRKKSIEDALKYLKAAREKLVGNLKVKNKFAQDNNKIENVFDEELLKEFHDDLDGDTTLLEATEVASLINSENWEEFHTPEEEPPEEHEKEDTDTIVTSKDINHQSWEPLSLSRCLWSSPLVVINNLSQSGW